MFDKALFDKQMFDKASGEFELYAFVDIGADMLLTKLSAKAPASGDFSATVDLQAVRLLLRVPAKADIEVRGEFEFTDSMLKIKLPIKADLPIHVDMNADAGTKIQIKADISFSQEFTSEILKARMPVIYGGPADILISGDVSPKVVARIKMNQTDVVVTGNVTGRLWARVRFMGSDIPIAGDLQPVAVAGLGSALLEFLNINLAPGQTLIIDTDTLESWIDDIPDVTHVTTESEFFHLIPGDNQLIFRDGESSRNLQVTAVWANRWL